MASEPAHALVHAQAEIAGRLRRQEGIEQLRKLGRLRIGPEQGLDRAGELFRKPGVAAPHAAPGWSASCSGGSVQEDPLMTSNESGRVGYLVLYLLGAPIGLLLLLWVVLGDNLIGAG